MNAPVMSTGRLRAIASYHARGIDKEKLGHKCVGELLAEVERLRAVLQAIAEGRPTARPARTGEGDLDQAYNLQATAVAALKEPDIGKPDFICRASDIREEDIR